jgi:PAS domain S-box-containing protein
MGLRQAEAARLLGEYHDRLEKAAGEGPVPFAEVFLRSPAGVGVHEIDRAMRVVRVNPEELKILGYSEGAVLGKPVWEMIVMQEAAKRAIEQKLRGERELRPFVRGFRRADGTAIALLLLDRLIRDSAGAIVGIRTAMTEVKPDAALPT